MKSSTLTAAELRDAAVSLKARATGILARLSRDPIARSDAEREAIKYRRLADKMLTAAKPNGSGPKRGRA